MVGQLRPYLVHFLSHVSSGPQGAGERSEQYGDHDMVSPEHAHTPTPTHYFSQMSSPHAHVCVCTCITQASNDI